MIKNFDEKLRKLKFMFFSKALMIKDVCKQRTNMLILKYCNSSIKISNPTAWGLIIISTSIWVFCLNLKFWFRPGSYEYHYANQDSKNYQKSERKIFAKIASVWWLINPWFVWAEIGGHRAAKNSENFSFWERPKTKSCEIEESSRVHFCGRR